MKDKIAIIGLGYVGLPLAVAMAKKNNLIGFDINKKRVSELNSGLDSTNELTKTQVLESLGKTIEYTNTESDLEKANFFIVTVPTPINKNKTPNLNSVVSATKTVAKYLKKDSLIMF